VTNEWIYHHLHQGMVIVINNATLSRKKQLLPFVSTGMVKWSIPSCRWTISLEPNEWLFSPRLDTIPAEYDGISLTVQSLYPSRTLSKMSSVVYETRHASASTEILVPGKNVYPAPMTLVRYNATPRHTLAMYHDFATHYHRPLLNLIIYNPSSPYEQRFYSILSSYLATIPYLTYYFIALREQMEPVMIEHDIMYIAGKENMLPGVLEKTIKALTHCMTIPFTYFIRSNISTWIHYEKFPFSELLYHSIDYTSTSILRVYLPSSMYQVGWKHIGTRYAQGTNIILSRRAATYLVEQQALLDYQVIDDLAIHNVVSQAYGLVSIQSTLCTNLPYETTFTYRHKSDNRDQDVNDMKKHIERYR